MEQSIDTNDLQGKQHVANFIWNFIQQKLEQLKNPQKYWLKIELNYHTCFIVQEQNQLA